MSMQVLYPSAEDIPVEELPFVLDADGLVRLCNDCFGSLVERWSFLPNEIHPDEGELCVGCGWRSQGPRTDSISAAVHSLVQARLHGATDEDIASVVADSRFFADRERWKDDELSAPPTSPSGGLGYRLADKPRRLLRGLMRGN